ncbi:prepilin-type N-terminal cleavage/methylation domain-containing protein [Thermodesulfobacteriota bacterium]
MKKYFEEYRHGFTLLEVMFALSLIGISLTVLLVSQSQGLSLANEAKFNTTASLLAQRRMAEIEMENINDIVSTSGDFGEDYSGYYWELNVDKAELPDLGDSELPFVKIDLKVYFGEKGKYRYDIRFYKFAPGS